MTVIAICQSKAIKRSLSVKRYINSSPERERNVEVVESDSMISVVAAVKKENRIFAIVIVTSQATGFTATQRLSQTSARDTMENTLNLCARVYQEHL